jgi:preprotein translocase subunit YajC
MDLMTILLLVIFAFFIFTMFRRNKKAQAQQAQMQSKFVPGVEVMTSFGLFGRIVSFDEAENKVVLELSPGTTATVHRQAVSKIVEPTETPVDGDVADTTIEPPLGRPPRGRGGHSRVPAQRDARADAPAPRGRGQVTPPR